MVTVRSSVSSFSQARAAQSQTAIRPFTRISPNRPVVEAPAASSIQRMLRHVAQAMSTAVGGSNGTARAMASTPAR